MIEFSLSSDDFSTKSLPLSEDELDWSSLWSIRNNITFVCKISINNKNKSNTKSYLNHD